MIYPPPRGFSLLGNAQRYLTGARHGVLSQAPDSRSQHFRATIILLAVALIYCWSTADVQAQLILRDQNGPNLYVAGTPASDIIFVWEEAGDLLVSVNGKLTNVTARTGVTANQVHCVGANLYGGDDIISYQWLPATSGGTRTNGGDGTDVVFEGQGVHAGSNVANWVSLDPVTEPSDEPTASGATEDPNTDGSELTNDPTEPLLAQPVPTEPPPPYPIEPSSEDYEPIPEPLLPPGP